MAAPRPIEEPAAMRRRIQASFDRQAIMRLLGARLGRVEPGVVEIELDASPDTSQQDGFVHAGVLSTIADSAGGYAALTMAPDAPTVLTIEYKVNFMSPAPSGRLVARGRCLKSGRTISVCRLEVESVVGDQRTPCVRGLQTLFTPLRRPADPGQPGRG